jgi:hypothetical protein
MISHFSALGVARGIERLLFMNNGEKRNKIEKHGARKRNKQPD